MSNLELPNPKELSAMFDQIHQTSKNVHNKMLSQISESSNTNDIPIVSDSISREGDKMLPSLDYDDVKYFDTVDEVHNKITRVTNNIKSELPRSNNTGSPSISYRNVMYSDCQY